MIGVFAAEASICLVPATYIPGIQEVCVPLSVNESIMILFRFAEPANNKLNSMNPEVAGDSDPRSYRLTPSSDVNGTNVTVPAAACISVLVKVFFQLFPSNET